VRPTMIALVLAVLAAAALSSVAAGSPTTTGPVVKWNTKSFGAILATPGHLALYTWNKEKDKKVHCTGACAKTWPPVTVPKGTMVPKHVAGVMGTFGEIMRADGRTQVTLGGRPLYTFHGDSPKKILCNGVDGWFVVKAH
jgi:predicted lipoprotein with Yx(FWY)xxD motif